MSTTQMNIRFDESLKTEGTAVFARAGYTPTQVIHEVWAFARRNAGNTTAVRDMMEAISDTTPGAKHIAHQENKKNQSAQKSAAIKHSEKLRAQQRELLGTDKLKPNQKNYSETEYEEALQRQLEEDDALYEELMMEKLQEGDCSEHAN